MRSIIRFFAHAQVVAFNRLQMTLGEEPKSTALGVESVLRKSLGQEAMHSMEIESNDKAARAWG